MQPSAVGILSDSGSESIKPGQLVMPIVMHDKASSCELWLENQIHRAGDGHCAKASRNIRMAQNRLLL